MTSELLNLNPKRALYTNTAIDSEPKRSTDASKHKPIICDDCNNKAGAIGPLIFYCTACQHVTRVTPSLGRVTYSQEQFSSLVGDGTPLPYDKLADTAEKSAQLEPLNPLDY